MDMAHLVSTLKELKGDKPVEDWVFEINTVVGPENKLRTSTMYAYLNGQRKISGKGAKALAMYFYRRGDLNTVNVITSVILGIPYQATN